MLSGFLPNGHWGISDWDYYFSYHEVVRHMTLTYGEVPTWNPYICGGTSAIGDPEFPLFTPTFLLELIAGIPLGLRLASILTTAVGGIGVLALARSLKQPALSGFIAALTFSFGSVTILELIEGHPNVFSVMYIPWIFWAWYNAYVAEQPTRQRLWIIALALLLAATFLQSGIYLLMYTAGAFVFLIALAKRRRTAIAITATAGILALGVAAIKLIPVLLWLAQFQDQAYASSANTLLSLPDILFGRYLHGNENIVPNQGGGWHEYGAYIGPFAALLAVIGITRVRQSRLVRLLGIATIIALGISASGPLLEPVFDQAPFLPRSNISRLILFAILPIALLASIGATHVRQRVRTVTTGPWPRRTVLAALILVTGLLAADTGTLSQALTRQAFVLVPAVEVETAATPIEYTIGDYRTRDKRGVDHTRAYAGILAGYGTQSYCTVLGPSEPAVKTKQHKDEDQSYVQIADPAGSVELIEWRPNHMTVRATATKPSDVVLNANFAEGWLVNGESARDVSNRLATNVQPGEHELTFTYPGPGYRAGRIVTFLSLLAIAGYLAWHYRRSTTK